MGVILGYKKPVGSESQYWYGEVDGADRQFIRVMAGIAMPILDRTAGAAVVVGEIYSQANPIDLWAIDAAVGEWNEVKRGILQFRRDLKFDWYVTDTEQGRLVLMEMKEMRFGEPMATSDAAFPWALTEVGRHAVAELRLEGRFHLSDEIESILSLDPEPAHLAVQSVVCRMIHYPAMYGQKPLPRGMGKILGVSGL